MHTLELVRFLSDNANEALNKAATMKTGDATCLLNEAEELMTLASRIISRVGIPSERQGRSTLQPHRSEEKGAEDRPRTH